MSKKNSIFDYFPIIWVKRIKSSWSSYTC